MNDNSLFFAYNNIMVYGSLRTKFCNDMVLAAGLYSAAYVIIAMIWRAVV